MKQIYKAGLMMLACFALTVGAQDWYHERDGRFQNEEWRGHLFAHVRTDLDHVQSVTWPGGHDRYRLDKTKQKLDELQAKLESHRFDKGELDAVIGDLHKVVADNHMAPQDRDVLNDDLMRLRDYREHHDHWGH